jgi:hypothetical protein
VYREDVQPIIDRFSELREISECYWKADVVGDLDFGPADYWIKAFVILETETKSQFLEEYEWAEATVEFDEIVSPSITGFSDFYWTYNEEFSEKIIGKSFMGRAFFDTTNGVVYIEANTF